MWVRSPGTAASCALTTRRSRARIGRWRRGFVRHGPRFDKFNLRAKWNNLPAIADNKPVNGRRPAAGAAPRRDRNEKNTLRPKGRAGKVREYESNWNRAPHRRPGPCGHPQGDPSDYAYPRGRPVTDDIDAMGTVLLCYAGYGKTLGRVGYIAEEVQEPRPSVVRNNANSHWSQRELAFCLGAVTPCICTGTNTVWPLWLL